VTRLYIAGTGNVAKNLLKVMKTIPGLSVYGMENSRGSIYGYGPLDGSMIQSFMTDPISHGKHGSKVEDLDFDIYVDLSTASRDGIRERRTYEHMFYAGKQVVTANKSGLANFFPEIREASLRNKRRILYEATVAGGLPIFSLLEGSFMPFSVKEFRGVVNLTSNFVLKNIRKGLKPQDAMEMAIREGVAETDMKDDLDGTDSARKTVIVANALFGYPVRLSDLKYGGIDPQNVSDNSMVISYVNDQGVIHSGIENLNKDDPLLRLDPMSMAAEISFNERSSVFISASRDGPLETAGAVLNDILTLKI